MPMFATMMETVTDCAQMAAATLVLDKKQPTAHITKPMRSSMIQINYI